MINLEFIPGDSRLVILCDEDAPEVLQEKTGVSILMIRNPDWNNDLSPWPAARVFRKGEDFGGGADKTIALIREWLESHPGQFEKTVIAGYSLAGLFALYAAAQLECFDGCVSASGSLWYPDFVQWLESHPVHCGTVYLSLGDQEKKARNPLMASVEEKTNQVYGLISSYAGCTFVMNPGNHFSDPQGRLLAGIEWVLENL